MHEYSLATNLVEAAGQLADEHHAVRIERLVCRVGAFDQIVPGVLIDAFSRCAVGSIAEDAHLVLDVQPFRMRCRRCEHTCEADASLVACPACGSPDVSLLGDHGMRIVSITLETDDED